jgi:hypothetical protein
VSLTHYKFLTKGDGGANTPCFGVWAWGSGLGVLSFGSGGGVVAMGFEVHR